MSGAGGARLAVEAHLTVRVTDPRGRGATVVVDDHDGAVRVRVDGPGDLAVLLGSAPRAGAGDHAVGPALRALLRAPGRDGPQWDQDVELFVGRQLLLQRRAGRWRPTPAAVVPVVLATASALVTAGLVVAAVVLLLGRVLRAVPRRRDGGGASG